MKDNMKTKKQIIDERPWLKQIIDNKGVDIVVGGDLDGFLSGLILTKHFATVRGIYNNRQLALHKDSQGKDCVFVDFDITRPNVRSIGHHITSHSKKNNTSHLYHLEGIQINEIYQTYVKSPVEKRNFSYKYPFSTSIFLLWLLDYDLMQMTKWQRFLILQADGVVNNINNYPHSMKEWITRIFGKFMFDPIASINGMESMDFNIRFRELRGQYVQNKAKGQGKGIEKTKTIAVSDDGILEIPQQQFIEAFGNEVGFPYLKTQWQCWNNMEGYNFDSNTFDEKPVANFRKLMDNNKNELISLIFSNTQSKIDYTTASENIINDAFGCGMQSESKQKREEASLSECESVSHETQESLALE